CTADKSTLIRTAMIAITRSSSIRVKPRRAWVRIASRLSLGPMRDEMDFLPTERQSTPPRAGRRGRQGPRCWPDARVEAVNLLRTRGAIQLLLDILPVFSEA